jgi:hypothetical protein
VSQQIDWYLVRASGLVAWGLVAANVVWGLLLSAKTTRRPRPSWINDLHRFLGGLVLTFVAIHLVTLWFDEYIGFGLQDITVPMAAHWRPGAVAWGIVATYLLLAVQLTSWLMHRMPRRAWHAVHLLSFVAFAGTTTHALTAGADASHPLFQAFAWGTVAIVAVLTVYRVGVRARAKGRRRDLQARLDLHVPVARPTLDDVEGAIANLKIGARHRVSSRADLDRIRERASSHVA